MYLLFIRNVKLFFLLFLGFLKSLCNYTILAKKPIKGGTPANENRVIVKLKAK